MLQDLAAVPADPAECLHFLDCDASSCASSSPGSVRHNSGLALRTRCRIEKIVSTQYLPSNSVVVLQLCLFLEHL